MKKVLFIDDCIDNINLYEIYFKKNNELEVDYTTSGKKGISMALGDSYDVIFVDIQMPYVNGYDVVNAISKSVHCKIYALTGFKDRETLLQIEASPFTSYLAKPILKNQLLHLIING